MSYFSVKYSAGSVETWLVLTLAAPIPAKIQNRICEKLGGNFYCFQLFMKFFNSKKYLVPKFLEHSSKNCEKLVGDSRYIVTIAIKD